MNEPEIWNETVDHTWKNWLEDKAPYTCKCGVDFDTHDALMKHTAELNPQLDTLTMGRAGAAIEREAHTNTLDLLRRARKTLQRIDEVLDGDALVHGSSCHQLIPDMPYYECRCGLKNLEEIQLVRIEPLLRDIKDQCPVLEEQE